MHRILLFLHIAGGIVGLLSGAAAMGFRKGSPGHRVSGNVFVVFMLVMGACGSTLALMKHQLNNVFGGLLTFYMITTAWSAGRRRNGQISVLDWGAPVFGLTIGVSLITLGGLVASGSAGSQAGVPQGMCFFMGTIPLLAAAGDIRMIVRGGITGAARVARHLWRMCFGLFIATGSFFLGQQQVIPAVLRKQYLLVPLAVLPLVLLIYWLIRISVFKSGIGSFFSQRTRELQRAA